MHQLINSDFSGLGNVLSSSKSTVSSPLRGVGKRSFVTVNFKSTKDKPTIGIEFFVENVVNTVPSDPDFGFTFEDLTLFRGVAIYLIDDTGNDKLTEGEVISFGNFLDRYISNDEYRAPIERCMNRLEEEAEVKQQFLDKLNMIWLDREATRKELYDKKVH